MGGVDVVVLSTFGVHIFFEIGKGHYLDVTTILTFSFMLLSSNELFSYHKLKNADIDLRVGSTSLECVPYLFE